MLAGVPARDEQVRAQELRHRLGNNFQLLQSLIQRRRRRSADPAVRQELGLMLQAVTALGQLQRQLDTSDTIDFAAHLTAVAEPWRELLREQAVELTLNLMPVRLPESTASALALAANELIANCSEHAFQTGRRGRIDVSLLIDEKGFVELSVSDDGSGLGGAPLPPRGGLRLVRALARRIGGSFSLHDGQGVVACLWFPLPANED